MRYSRSLALFALLAAAVGAHADTLSFSFGSATSAYSGSGTLTTGKLLAFGEYTVASLTGTVNALGSSPVAVASLLDSGTFPTVSNGGGFPANDNVIFFINGIGTFSQDGVSFLLTNGTQVNLYNGGTAADVFILPKGGSALSETTPIIIRAASAITPEPASFLLVATGLLSACLLRRAV